MKIVCDLPVNPDDLDLASMDDVKAECVRRPLERPCTMLRGWVKKMRCLRCSHCGKVFYEDGEADALKAEAEKNTMRCKDCLHWAKSGSWSGLCRLAGCETSNVAKCQKIEGPRTWTASEDQRGK